MLKRVPSIHQDLIFSLYADKNLLTDVSTKEDQILVLNQRTATVLLSKCICVCSMEMLVLDFSLAAIYYAFKTT